jgi:hypothetical protein
VLNGIHIAIAGTVLLFPLQIAAGQPPQQSKRPATVTVPSWYLDPPSVNDTLIARGKGKSNDEQVAIDKAITHARGSLARKIDERWRDLLRGIEKESGVHLAWTPGEVVLKGSTARMQQVFRRGRVWTAYVLVGLSEASARDVLLRRLHHDSQWYEKVKDTKAVRDLERVTP